MGGIIPTPQSTPEPIAPAPEPIAAPPPPPPAPPEVSRFEENGSANQDTGEGLTRTRRRRATRPTTISPLGGPANRPTILGE